MLFYAYQGIGTHGMCLFMLLSECAENIKSTFLKTTSKFGRGLSGSILGSTKLVNVLF